MPLFVVPCEIPQTIPVIAVLVDIVHTAPQAGLQIIAVVLEQMHDHGPTERCKDRPGVVAYRHRLPVLRDDRQPNTRLDGQAREREHHPREDVDDDLLVHGRDLAGPGPAPEDEVAAEQPGEEAVVLALLARRAPVPLEQVAHGLVDGRELGQVARVGPRRAEHEVALLPDRARAEQEDHHQGVREPHLGAVDCAIAGALADGEEVAVRRVEDDSVQGVLRAQATC